MQTTLQVLFWLALGAVFYAYFGYPLLLMAWRAVRPRPVTGDPSFCPAISIILPVHNEAAQLNARLETLLALDYPSDHVEIIVVSDGSTDGTEEIAKRAHERDGRISLIRVVERRGKGHAMNSGVAAARHEIIVFVDAGIEIEKESLRALVAPFADATVGCVSGEDQVRGSGGEGLYGRYEFALRRLESDVHSIIGASGSFFALRRALCPSFPEGLAPDFVSVLHVVSGGYRAISAKEALGWLDAVSQPSAEFNRKVRTLIRGMTALRAYASLLLPWRGGLYSMVLWSHKVMRWLVPFNLVVVFGLSVLLIRQPFFLVATGVQVLFYGLSIVALVLGAEARIARIPGYFVIANAAIVVAFWSFVRGRRVEVWAPSRR